MKRLLTVLTGIMLSATPGLSAQETDLPTGAVDAFFQAMKAGDADAMAALLHPDARLASTSVRDGVPVVQMVEMARFLDSVRSSKRVVDERLHDVQTLRDHGLAVVWGKYDVYVDGTLSHCGVDAFQLVRTEDGWRILDIADTRQTEGCGGS